MAKYQYQASVRDGKATFKYDMPVFSFMDDHTYIVYAPALDLSGYGKTEKEAKESFNEVFRAFVNYTSNKNSLFKVLRRLGWKVSSQTKLSKKPIEIKAPGLQEMLFRDEYLVEVFQTREFHKYNQRISLTA